MIDWSNLKPYHDDTFRSFEELCYQIAKGIYSNQGRFTSIDDTGGGDGVEFYLTLPDGSQIGWQAKFYHPNPRLAASNRKAQIKKSLVTACDHHPHLSKWILCTPTNFTMEEQEWFDQTLAQAIPATMNVELEHWGDSDFNTWLSEPRFSGKRHYFFGELELSLDWFRQQSERQLEGIRAKFNPTLHTETTIDHRIHSLLGDNAFVNYLSERVAELNDEVRELSEAVDKLRSPYPRDVIWPDGKATLVAAAVAMVSALTSAVSSVTQARDLLAAQDLTEARLLDWNTICSHAVQAYSTYTDAHDGFDVATFSYVGESNDGQGIISEAERAAYAPIGLGGQIIEAFRNLVPTIHRIEEVECHILGDAGLGKTHIAGHICEARLRDGLPALFVMGACFTSDRPFTAQLLEILGVPSVYGWQDFLGSIQAAAEAYQTRVPLVIDGLNESTHHGLFSNIWERDLPGLGKDLAEAGDVVLVTTCRTTYREAIWPNCEPPGLVYAHGFDPDQVEDAVDRYFEWYRIRADLTGVSLAQFRHPIYLRIFCEAQNPRRDEDKQVYIGEQTLYDVFDGYLDRCDKVIRSRLDLPPRLRIVGPALAKVAEYLWRKRTRSMPLDALLAAVDGHENVAWSSSLTKALLDEGLLVDRDWRENLEVAFFTYDLLGGYLIAQHLLEEVGSDVAGFVQDVDTVKLLFTDNYATQHPLASDIRRSLAALLPVQRGQYLHDLSNEPCAFDASFEALFEIAPQHIDQECVELVIQLFGIPQNRQRLLELGAAALAHVGHPLNADFWSARLRELALPDRDLSWSEYLRANPAEFRKLIRQFEAVCRRDGESSEISNARLRLLAEHIMWMLTSTVRDLRDEATRALYWYGRRYPQLFIDQVLRSLEINDQYVPERMLAAAYGVAMARQHDCEESGFPKDMLVSYARRLYAAMFAPGAPYATTHLFARDYARRTINIALLHQPDLLNTGERERITPPFSDGGIREWGDAQDLNRHEYRDGNYPLGSPVGDEDVVGWMGPGVSKYHMDSPEYRQAAANLWWRIYQLGYSFDRFAEVDLSITRWHWDEKPSIGHYGGKYAWIAAYELMGLRDDQGLLHNEWHQAPERDDHIDIDPSFPSAGTRTKVVEADTLGDRAMPVAEWIRHSDDPDYGPYLVASEVDRERGPWILLNGYLNQDEKTSGRSRFAFLRGFLVKSEDERDVLPRLVGWDRQSDRLPEAPDCYYTFAGEIPWGDTYPPNEEDELCFTTGTETIQEESEDMVLLRDGREVPETEAAEFWESVSDCVRRFGTKLICFGADPEQTLAEALDANGLKMEIRQVSHQHEVATHKTFAVWIPVRADHWESYHNHINPGQAAESPSKQIALHLELQNRPQTFDLFDQTGRRASITIDYTDDNGWKQRLTYLRQDLAERILRDWHMSLVWIVWGERGFSPHHPGFERFREEHVPYVPFQDVRVYRPGTPSHLAIPEKVPPSDADIISAIDASVQVYITQTGKRYHIAGCRHARRTKPVNRADAVASGYTPCPVCKP